MTETAGHLLDMIVAEKIMGWKWMRFYDLDYQSPDGPLCRSLIAPDDRWLEPPKYVECDLSKKRERDLPTRYHGPEFSTDMAAAWTVVEMLMEEGRVFSVIKADGLRDKKSDRFTVVIDGEPRVDAKTAQLAICLAALKSKESNVQK